MVQLEKYPISKVEKLLNLDDQRFYKISEILQSNYVVIRDTKSNTFYFKNYFDWDQFNQLYDIQ